MIVNEFTQPPLRSILGCSPQGHGPRRFVHSGYHTNRRDPENTILRKAVENDAFHQVKKGNEAHH